MKQLACVLTLLAGAGCATAQQREVSKLGNITYDPYAGVLTWTVQQGTFDKDRNFKTEKERKYSINFQAATMSDGQETRNFSKEEAEGMYELFNAVIARYARESTTWWIHPPPKKLDKPDGSVRL